MSAAVLGTLAAVATVDALRRHLPRLSPVAVRLPPVPMRVVRIVGLLALGLISPPLPAIVLIGTAGRRFLRTRRQARQHARAVARALPDVVDLLLLATGAGLTFPIAHPLVARHAAWPLSDALDQADTAAGAGLSRADALVDALAPLGEAARSLAAVIVDHLRYGVPLAPGLERLHLELRLERRRAAEMEARKVPVRLLAPLVTCVLPAFALLTVVPLLAASLEALPT